ncbi:hypothetical protein XBFM1_2200017 [Xenorhabdus bovienii str. feltiae Moldova]|uniref:Uncharacterized protein n=2 Tax=Xenorhabdus bovienii TaxID=40576 RepID=A0A077NHE3_XENBV|nr:hypothetical protein XBFM1_2200017 [Xenorhabdus bovienii str. feltiae Moldova]
MLRLANTPKGSTAADAIIEQTQSLVNSILQGERAELTNKN